MAEYEPMRAVLVRAPFSDPGWVFERQLDGIRAGVVRRGGTVRLVSRSGQSLDATYPELVDAIEAQHSRDLVADDEVVAFERGRTSFARLQRRMQIHDPERARATGIAVYLYLFDLLELGGEDLRSRPLRERKRHLRSAFRFGDGCVGRRTESARGRGPTATRAPTAGRA